MELDKGREAFIVRINHVIPDGGRHLDCPGEPFYLKSPERLTLNKPESGEKSIIRRVHLGSQRAEVFL